MWELNVVTGSVITIGALIGSLALLSPVQRKRAAALRIWPVHAASAWLWLGACTLASGLARSPWPSLVAGIPLILLVLRQRRALPGHDAPPSLHRILALPLSPLTILRHPVVYGRAVRDAYGRPAQTRAETANWLAERDL